MKLNLLEKYRLKKFDEHVSKIVSDLLKVHDENLECLVCQAVKAGLRPQDIVIVQRRDGFNVRTYIDLKEKY